jgi:hypothetical protein
MAVIDGSARTATVKAAIKSEVIRLPGEGRHAGRGGLGRHVELPRLGVGGSGRSQGDGADGDHERRASVELWREWHAQALPYLFPVPGPF